MKTIQVKTSNSYEVKIGTGILSEVNQELQDNQKVAIITDETVAFLYLEKLKNILQKEGHEAEVFMFPSGEESKCIKVLSCLLEWLADMQMTRSDTIIAFGGGVTGDLAGFAASIYLRGIAYIQIPTTFLAMIDSSVGGKTGIDLQAGKNLAGSFWQPKSVICDIDLLETLPEEIFSEGSAEAIKYGILGDAKMFELFCNGEVQEELEDIIYRCIDIKRDLVEEDEFDIGSRQLLNLGHTFGHCVEKLSAFEISHGNAVAIGLAIMAEAAFSHGDCDMEVRDEIIKCLERNGLSLHCPYSAEEMVEVMKLDKKRRGNYVTLIIPKSIGECTLQNKTLKEVEDYLRSGLQGDSVNG